jgi:hypothetical protein
MTPTLLGASASMGDATASGKLATAATSCTAGSGAACWYASTGVAEAALPRPRAARARVRGGLRSTDSGSPLAAALARVARVVRPAGAGVAIEPANEASSSSVAAFAAAPRRVLRFGGAAATCTCSCACELRSGVLCLNPVFPFKGAYSQLYTVLQHR